MSLKCLAENVPYQAIRILLFTTNLLLTLIGFLFLSFGLGFLSSREFGYTPKMSGLIISEETGEIKNSAFTFLGYPELIIMFSIILIITGLFGTFAIVNKNQATLMLHMILMLAICGSELVFGTLVYVRSDDILNGIQNDMKNSLKFYDNMEPDNKITSGWDFFQNSGQCCGVVSIDDWNNNLEDKLNINETANTILCQGRRVPNSCQTHNFNSINNATACFQTGCFTVVSEFISQRMVPISLIIMSIFLGQLLALLIAVILFGIQKLRNEAYNYGETRKKLLEN